MTTGFRLEGIPEESQEETSEGDLVSFFDAGPEHSPTNAAPRRTSKRRSIVRGILLVAAPVVLGVALAAVFSPHVFIQSWHKFWPSSIGRGRGQGIHDGPPCFEDFPLTTTDDVAAQEYLPPHCLAQSSLTACPPHAICRAGVMSGYLDTRHWQINGTACVLTPQAQDTVRATHALSENYSVHEFCGGAPYLQTTYDADLLQLANQEDLTFVLHRASESEDHDTICVVLHPRHSSDIPLRYTLQNYYAMVTQVVGAVMLGVLGILDGYLWGSLVTAAPLLLQTVVLVGGGSLVLWWTMMGIRRRNLAKRQRDLNIGNFRHAALLYLEGRQGRYVTSSRLCDHFLWKWFPSKSTQRERWKQQLWPCVVQDLRSDPRVKCVHQQHGPELMFKWHS